MNNKHSNIDINDAVINTNAPFTWECKRLLRDITLPINLFTSIKIYLIESNVPPCRISKVTPDRVEFADQLDNVIGYWGLNGHKDTGCGFILDSYGIIRGHVVADKIAPVIFKAAANAVADGELYTSKDDFILLPQCHSLVSEGVCKAIIIDDNPAIVTGDVIVKAGDGVIMDRHYVDSPIFISVYNDKKSNSIPAGSLGNGICKVVVDTATTNNAEYELDSDSQHVMLRHDGASNLRVLTEGSSIKITGVTNV